MHHAVISVLICSMCLGTASFAATTDIDYITVTDELGYACIDEAHFVETEESPALAFLIGGKLRLPRICVDDPCHAALTQRQLSQLTGTDPRIPRFVSEWNDYYARYADYCRKETTPNGGGVASSPNDFWERTRRPAEVSQAITTGSPVLPQSLPTGLSPTSAGGFPALTFAPFPVTSDNSSPNLSSGTSVEQEIEEVLQIGSADSDQVFNSEGDPNTNLLNTPLAVVPIQSTLFFLLTSLTALISLRRFRP